MEGALCPYHCFWESLGWPNDHPVMFHYVSHKDDVLFSMVTVLCTKYCITVHLQCSLCVCASKMLHVTNSTPEIASASNPPAMSQPSNDCANWQPKVCTAYYGVLQPCIRDHLAEKLAGAQVEMESVPDNSVSCDQLISKISEAHLVHHLY